MSCEDKLNGVLIDYTPITSDQLMYVQRYKQLMSIIIKGITELDPRLLYKA